VIRRNFTLKRKGNGAMKKFAYEESQDGRPTLGKKESTMTSSTPREQRHHSQKDKKLTAGGASGRDTTKKKELNKGRHLGYKRGFVGVGIGGSSNYHPPRRSILKGGGGGEKRAMRAMER